MIWSVLLSLNPPGLGVELCTLCSWKVTKIKPILLIYIPKSKVFFLAEPSKEVHPANLILNRLIRSSFKSQNTIFIYSF